MLRLISNITLTQVPTKDYPSRNKSLNFDFVHEVEINSSWANLTDTAKVVFPKNLYFLDENNQNVSLEGKNIISTKTNPVILRGDKIKIELGYIYIDEFNQKATDSNTVFEGFISKVNPRIPLELECEDNMYKLKQISVPNKVWKGYTLQSMMKEILKGTEFTVNIDAKTTIGNDFRTNNETAAQVLNRLQKYGLESYFRGTELRCSGLAYNYTDSNDETFKFTHNIIEDDLEYRRKDDLNIGVKAYSIKDEQQSETRQDGTKKTKKKRLEVFVTKDGKVSEEGFEGEKRTLYFFDVKTEDELVTLAKEQLSKLHYEGFYGSFLTFGMPFIKHGDNVKIIDPVLPERNGIYKAKGVNYTFGQGGYRQKIQLHIKTSEIYV
jgi:hypothetical protein